MDSESISLPQAYQLGKNNGKSIERIRIIERLYAHIRVCNYEIVHEEPCDVCCYIITEIDAIRAGEEHESSRS